MWRDVTSDISEVILAKRFGPQQKNKIRVIDDCSLGGYNKTYGTKEKLRVHAVDQIAAYLSWICTELGEQLDDAGNMFLFIVSGSNKVRDGWQLIHHQAGSQCGS